MARMNAYLVLKGHERLERLDQRLAYMRIHPASDIPVHTKQDWTAAHTKRIIKRLALRIAGFDSRISLLHLSRQEQVQYRRYFRDELQCSPRNVLPTAVPRERGDARRWLPVGRSHVGVDAVADTEHSGRHGWTVAQDFLHAVPVGVGVSVRSGGRHYIGHDGGNRKRENKGGKRSRRGSTGRRWGSLEKASF